MASLALTIAAGVFAAQNLSINSGTDGLLSPDLPYQKPSRELQEAFPQLYPVLVVVLQATSTERADAAAAALASRLAADSLHFHSVFYPQGDSFFRRNGLLFLPSAELETLADRLAAAQPLLASLAQDPSLRGLAGVLGLASRAIEDGHTDGADFAPALGMIADAITVARADPRTQLSWGELIGGEPAPATELRRIILAQPVLDRTSLQPAKAALAAVDAAIAALGLADAPDVRVQLTGDVAMDEDELRSVEEGATTASAICFVLVGVVALLGLKSGKLVLATMGSLAMSLVWTTAFAAIAVGHLNLISVGFGVLFIGMAVDFTIQLVMRVKEEIECGRSVGDALDGAARGSGPAVAIAASAAAIGFFSFVPTDYRGLAELGIISSGGMLIGLFATLTVAPAMIASASPRLALRPPPSPNERTRWLFIVEHPRSVVLGAFALGLIALAAVPFVRFDTDPINLKDPATESVRTFRALVAANEAPPYSINVLTPNEVAAEALAAKLRALPEVGSALTVRQFVPSDQDQKLAVVDQLALILSPIMSASSVGAAATPAENRAALEALQAEMAKLAASEHAGAVRAPAERLARAIEGFLAGGPDDAHVAALNEALVGGLGHRLEDLRLALEAEPITVADLPPALRARFIAADGRARVEVFSKEPLSDVPALERFVGAVRAIAPDATDTPVLLLEVGRTMVHAFYMGGLYALVMITLLLVVVLRSVRDAVLVLAPLAIASSLTTATMALFGIAFNFANIIAMPLLFSLGVAFGIYLVIRDREAPTIADLMRTSTPRAVIFSAITTMVSFGSLMVSPHRGTASMGELLAIALTYALACTVIVLPALLAWRDQGWTCRRSGGASAPR